MEKNDNYGAQNKNGISTRIKSGFCIREALGEVFEWWYRLIRVMAFGLDLLDYLIIQD